MTNHRFFVATLLASLILMGAAAGVALPTQPPSQCGSLMPVGCEEWATLEEGPAGQSAWDQPNGATISPDGSVFYVVGEMEEDLSLPHTAFGIVAFDADTGAKLWRTVLAFGTSWDNGLDAAVTPDGARLIVSGRATLASGASDVALAALDAQTGDVIWTKLFDMGTADGYYPRGLALSADGARVFVAGEALHGTQLDFMAASFDVATGDELWRATWGNGDGTHDFPYTMAFDGERIYVMGRAVDPDENWDAIVVAFNATTAAVDWTHRLDVAETFDVALRATISGPRLIVAGVTVSPAGDGDEVLLYALDRASGASLWTAYYGGAGGQGPNAIATSPDGSMLYVAGYSEGKFLALSHHAADGKYAWDSTFDPGQWASAHHMTLSPDGSRLYLTGQTDSPQANVDLLTAGVAADSGAFLWQARYDGPGQGLEGPVAIVTPRDGERILIASETHGAFSGMDYLALSYYVTSPPSAYLAVNTQWIGEPRVEFKLDAWDGDGSITVWRLDVDGDGLFDHEGSGAPPQLLEHTYPAPGSYHALLWVADDEGGVGTAEVDVDA